MRGKDYVCLEKKAEVKRDMCRQSASRGCEVTGAADPPHVGG